MGVKCPTSLGANEGRTGIAPASATTKPQVERGARAASRARLAEMPKIAFVLNGDGKPLAPTKAGRAGYLIRKGKARLIRKIPMVIKLNYVVEGANPQECTIGIDEGAKYVGISVAQHCQSEDKVVFKGELQLRRDVKQLMANRRARRRLRRSKLEARQPRQRRAIRVLCPSALVRKQNVLRAIQNIAKWLPISEIVIEECKFDTKKNPVIGI